MTRRPMVRLLALVLVCGLSTAAAKSRALLRAAGIEAPRFTIDSSWHPRLPAGWTIGLVSAVATDARDNVWVLQRPRNRPAGGSQQVAPPVLEFDQTGKFLQGWGGPSNQYEWPDREHALYVDHKGHVWISGTARPSGGRGTGRSDDMLLKFTDTGKLLLQVGHRGRSGGATDTQNVYGVADLFVDEKTNELFAGDEGNLRVIVFDAETGAFKRMWSAYGSKPVDPPPAGRGANAAPAGHEPSESVRERPPFKETHSVRVSDDGLVYVADRPNRRIQVFELDGKYVTEVLVNPDGPADASAVGLEFSRDKKQRFLYVADFGNNRIVVMDRKSLTVLYQFGRKGTGPGDFQGVHYLAVDSHGNLYTDEVEPGNRIQKFLFEGVAAPPQS